MNSVEIVKKLCQERGISIARLERECNFSNGYINKLKNGVFKTDKLQTIADYFGVPVDYFLEVPISGHHSEYYIDERTAQLAQQYFDDPMTRALFDARQGASPEDVQMAIDLLNRLKRTNPDG